MKPSDTGYGESGATNQRPPVKRLFFAVWPPASIGRALAALQQRHCPESARRIPAASLHLTLLFVGDCDAASESALRVAADRLRLPPFEVVLERLGGRKRGGVMWSAPTDTPAALLDLAADLRAIAAAAGVAVERRGFQAHVTLARRAGEPPSLGHAPIAWRVDEFSLVASTLAARGARYTQVERWPLR